MEFYCGTDIIEVERVKKAILETAGFKEKIFTKKEIEMAITKSDKPMYEYYAGRFAAKEAIYKAVSKIKDDFNFWEIEILNDKQNKNRPVVIFQNEVLRKLQIENKLKLDVSISHVSEYATAIATTIYMA